MRTKLRSKISLLFVAFAVMLAVPAVVMAAELHAELDSAAPQEVTVEQGKTANFDIKLSAAGAINENITVNNPATADVHTNYSIAANGAISSNTFSGTPVKFYASTTTQGQHKAVTGGGSVAASVGVDPSTPTGTYKINLSSGPSGNLGFSNPSNLTPNLSDSQTNQGITVQVVQPAAPADTTGPDITITTPANDATYLVNQVVNANYQCSDPSGVASCGGPVANGAAIDTASVDSKSFKVNAEDSLGNKSSLTHNYNVRAYDFIGFSSPVDNPTVLNNAKAGQAIPLKWRLMDNGTPVTNLQSVKVTVQSLSCTQGTTSDNIEEYAAGSSGLQNLGDGYYQFNWKSPTTYANSCKTLAVNGLGVQSQALFKFTK